MRHQRYEYFAFRLGLLLAEAQFTNLVLAHMLLGAPHDLQDPSTFTRCLEAATMEVFTADPQKIRTTFSVAGFWIWC
jgi:hypothetical protein